MGVNSIKWGIIGCGDVAEVKSGPAFSKIPHSQLLAVMRRNAQKAEDFARRHQVPAWYSDHRELLNHPEINAVYIATPPASHLAMALESIAAGKMVYLEKPMVLNVEEARQLENAIKESKIKVCVAHYRRFLPAFVKVKEVLEANVLGNIRFAEIKILQPLKSEIIAESATNWRLNPAISGGGYFYDLAPHQIDLMLHYFGEVQSVVGFANNQSKTYDANDMVTGSIAFQNGIHFQGTWAFNIHEEQKLDQCTIYAEYGAIHFSFYGDEVTVQKGSDTEIYKFNNPTHIQEPMIRKVVDYFMGATDQNPCSVNEGLKVMEAMSAMSKNPES